MSSCDAQGAVDMQISTVKQYIRCMAWKVNPATAQSSWLLLIEQAQRMEANRIQHAANEERMNLHGMLNFNLNQPIWMNKLNVTRKAKEYITKF